jgi:hypothetical protein
MVVKGALEKLTAYAEELGLAVKQEGRWLYDRDGKYLNLKIQFTVGGEAALADKERDEFEMVARWHGLLATDYGAVMTIKGKRYRLTRINTRRNVRYPFECESVDGGRGIRLPEVYKHEIIAARTK